MRNKNVLFIKTKLSDKHEALRRYNWADGALWCVSGEKRFLLVPSLKCECPKRTELKGSIRVLPTHDASKVRVSGPGVGSGIPASFPVEFSIDARDAGEGPLSVLITVSTTLD